LLLLQVIVFLEAEDEGTFLFFICSARRRDDGECPPRAGLVVGVRRPDSSSVITSRLLCAACRDGRRV